MSDFMNRVRNVATGRPVSTGSEISRVEEPPMSAPGQSVSPDALQGGEAVSAVAATRNSPDLLGIAPTARRLAEFAAHADTRTPLCLGISGKAGSGKSFALRRVMDDIAAYSSAAARLSGSPYIARTLLVRVNAAASGEPATRIAAALFDAMHAPAPDGRTYPALAEEAADAATDPADAARQARERLADARRRLDSEREALREMTARRARLSESILYETAGSRIDAHARVNRSKIESRLRGFGFLSGDPVATYKDLVRDVAENGGMTGRIRACLRAIWGFRGQTRLIVLAIVFFAAAWGLGEAQASQKTWIAWLQGQTSLKSVTGWIEAHTGWLAIARQAAVWAGVLALALNIFRATRFMLPIFHGVSLFNGDVESRNRDLDALIANQTQRVDDLAGEIEPLSKRAGEAESRAAASAGAKQIVTKSPFDDSSVTRATAFMLAIGAAVAAGDPRAPARVIVAVDNLDALAPDARTNFLAQARELLARPAFVTILAGEEDVPGLNRFVDMSMRLDTGLDAPRVGLLVKSALGTAVAVAAEAPPDASRSSLHQPMQPGEAALLEALAPVAASTPRDVTRFLTAYGIARGGFEHFGALAAAFALQAGATQGEREALERALDGVPDSETLTASGADRVNFVLDAARTAQRTAVTAGQMRAARAMAARWSA